MSIFGTNGAKTGEDNKIANKIQGGGAYCTNNIVQKCFSFAVSLALMLGMAPGKMAQAASEIPEGRAFSAVDASGVTVTSSWEDKYDQAFYSKIESEYENGYTTVDTALEIGTAAELAAFAKFVNDGVSSGYPDYKNSHGFENKFVCLTDDIDLQGVAPTVDYQNDGDDGFKVVLTGAVSNNWVPIDYFRGTFDGDGHSIFNVVICAGQRDHEYIGLFRMTNDVTIQNLGVKNIVVMGCQSAGKIVGYMNGTIQNCYASGTIYVCADDRPIAVAGIAANVYGTMKNCYNSGDIFAADISEENFVRCCGLCAGAFSCIVDNCFSTSRIYAYSSYCIVAGLASRADTISNCYYDKDAAPGISATDSDRNIDPETVKGLTTAEFEQKLTEITDENGDKMWFLAPGILDPRKTLHSSDFTFTLPEDLYYDGQGKVITIKPKDGITGIGAVTVKYYKVNSDGTLGAASITPPTDAGRYKIKFDVAGGTEYYSATDLPAMF